MNQPVARRTLILLACIVVSMILIRLPPIVHQGGGQDEDYFAPAGWTALELRPRIPYLPSRDREGVFYRADELLFALPPAYYFWSAPFHSICGPGYAAGRLASLVAASWAVCIVFLLGRRFQLSDTGCLISAWMFAFSRMLLFPATTARPDALATASALTAIYLALGTVRFGSASSMAGLSGAFAGLALLTHPFTLVAAVQAWVLLMLRPCGLKGKIARTVIFGVAALAVFSLWGLMIQLDPELWWIQFSNNVLGRAGPGLFQRLVSPWSSIQAQAGFLLELLGPIQAAVCGFGLTAALMAARQSGSRLAPALLAASSVALLIVLQGSHPSKGYWCYPGGFVCICLGGILSRWVAGRAAAVICIALLVAALVPGSGLKATYVYLRHWGNPDYSHSATVNRVLASIPADAKCLVDVGCVFDFHLAGRPTTLALNIRPFFEAKGIPFDYLVVTRTGLRQQLPSELGATKKVTAFGDPNDELACYVEVWRKRQED